jgi:flagellar hook-basal body complex protein FliE
MIPAIPSIPSISAAGPTPALSPGATTAVGATSSGSFTNILGNAIDSLNSVTNNATNLSLQAASGNATVADATIASTEADLATQLTSTVTTKAVQALNTILDMQL